MLRPLTRPAVDGWAFLRRQLGEIAGRRAAAAFFRHVTRLAAEAGSGPPLETPLVSLVCPTFNTRVSYLDDLLASFRAQRKGVGQLILSDDGSTKPATCAWLDRHSRDPDLNIVRNGANRGISSATNAGILRAEAPWIGFIDHDDALAPFALDRIARALESKPDSQFLFTDEAICDARLRVVDTFLKPAFDPVLLSGVNYINHLSFYRSERLRALGALRPGFEGSQDYDLLLRYLHGLRPEQIVHLPYPAYLWRRDGASYSITAADVAMLNARRAIAEAYDLPYGDKQVEDALGGSLHRIRFDREPREWPRVSVVIPNRDAFPLISGLLRGLTEETDYPDLEIVVIDNGTTDPRVLEIYERMTDKGGFEAVIEPEAFNFSRAMNKGFARASGSYLLMLNNDIEIVSRGWLKEMVSCFDYPAVGAVGTKLLYPDRTLQHAGVIVGFGTIAGHWYLRQPGDFPGPMGRFWVRQSLTAATGACLMVSRVALDRVGPLDEALFAIAYNDIDLCIRIGNSGMRVVWTPFATCIHHESASRGSDETPDNLERFNREKQNLLGRHATATHDDLAISPWYTKDRSVPIPQRLGSLPGARSARATQE